MDSARRFFAHEAWKVKSVSSLWTRVSCNLISTETNSMVIIWYSWSVKNAEERVVRNSKGRLWEMISLETVSERKKRSRISLHCLKKTLRALRSYHWLNQLDNVQVCVNQISRSVADTKCTCSMGNISWLLKTIYITDCQHLFTGLWYLIFIQLVDCSTEISTCLIQVIIDNDSIEVAFLRTISNLFNSILCPLF